MKIKTKKSKEWAKGIVHLFTTKANNDFIVYELHNIQDFVAEGFEEDTCLSERLHQFNQAALDVVF